MVRSLRGCEISMIKCGSPDLLRLTSSTSVFAIMVYSGASSFSTSDGRMFLVDIVYFYEHHGLCHLGYHRVWFLAYEFLLQSLIDCVVNHIIENDHHI
ncbi:hypothetical protein M5689_012510 [Euphorbia peplus]|nr:hypothetical protein M5689_012510 [Euphorbia peplus]